MADNNNKKNVTNSDQLRNVQAVAGRTEGLVYGVSGDFLEKDRKVSASINDTISKIQTKYKRKTGQTMLDYYKNVEFTNKLLHSMFPFVVVS